ncbi:SDR family oxidoreductase [Rhodococcus sp. NPDC057529]|uniref:SDR family oxidoreductase n=1 Tax=Rhodococcus sp. NPDC057529 TaxID=3346158 RepID=UPI0036706F04
MTQLDGKIALITGGGFGLGAARRMIEEGATVYIAGRDQARLDDAVAHLGARAQVTRVTKKTEMDTVATTILQGQGKLDIVFANAGAEIRFLISGPCGDRPIGRVTRLGDVFPSGAVS